MSNRPKAEKYKNRMQELQFMEKLLTNEAIQRLTDLTTRYPDAPIALQNDVIIKAKSLSKEYVKTMPFENAVYYIDAIEKHLETLQPYKQLEIDFLDID